MTIRIIEKTTKKILSGENISKIAKSLKIKEIQIKKIEAQICFAIR